MHGSCLKIIIIFELKPPPKVISIILWTLGITYFSF